MNIGFKSVHPVGALAFFVFAFAFCLISSNPFSLGLCVLCGAIYDLTLQKKKTVSYIFKFLLPMTVLVTVFNGIFSHYGVTVLFVMHNGNNFTLEALVYGFVTGVRLGGMLLWLDCFNEVLTSEKIIFLFGRISPRLALVISMVLRFIPLIRTQSAEISTAQKGIGASDGKSFFAKVKSASRRLSILVSWTLEKGVDTSDSMRARGYGLRGRTSFNRYNFSLSDAVVTGLSAVAFAVSIVLYKKLSAEYNPIIDIPVPDVISVSALVLFAAVLLMPVIIDLKNRRYTQPRIDKND